MVVTLPNIAKNKILRLAWSRPSSLTLITIATFTALRWNFAARHQISRWVVAGAKYANPNTAHPYLHVFLNSNGYDGQFFWRMAAKPWLLTITAFDGVSLSSTYRLNRIVYPFLAWIFAGGRTSLISWSLVIVNSLALLVLAQCGISQALRAGKSPWLGLSLLLVPGLVGAYSRDLSEILSVVFLLLAILVARNERWFLTGVLLSLGVLTRESLLIPIFAFGIVHLIACWRERNFFGARHLVWLLPAVSVISWQLILYRSLHTFPLFSAGNKNLGVPIVGLFSSMNGWFRIHTIHHLGEVAIIVLQLVAFVALIYVAWRARNKQRTAEVAVFAASVMMVICETRQGWKWPFDLRYGVDSMVIGWLFILESNSNRAIRMGIFYVVPAVLATVVLRTFVI